MIKTGLEIVEMIAKGKQPKKIKNINNIIYTYDGGKYRTDKGRDLWLDNIMSLNSEFEIIEEPKVWKPKEGEEYWYMNESGIQFTDKWENTLCNQYKYELGNCFKTLKEMQKENKKKNKKKKLERYAEEHNTEKIDWQDEEQEKWYIDYYPLAGDITTQYTTCCQSMNEVYFTSKEALDNAIKEIGEDNIKKLFEE